MNGISTKTGSERRAAPLALPIRAYDWPYDDLANRKQGFGGKRIHPALMRHRHGAQTTLTPSK